MGKIRMGVIGLGGISHVHINGIKQSPDAELTAVCDIEEDVLRARGDMYGIPHTHRFTDYRELLACPDVDAVSICTSNDAHYEVAMEAVRRRKPFALEKPVTMNYREAKELKEKALEAGVPNMVCFSYRFIPAARYAREIVRSGKLGRIYHIYGQYIQSWGQSHNTPLVWRFLKEKSGSGVLGDLGSHLIDLTRFILGAEFRKACAHARTYIDRRKIPGTEEYGTVDVDDFTHFLAELDGDISGTFAVSRYGYARGNYQRVEIYGDRGAVIYNLEDTDIIQVCIGDVYKEARAFIQLPVPGRFRVSQMQSFFDIVNGKGDGLAATIEDGAISQMVIDGLIESFEKEKWVRF